MSDPAPPPRRHLPDERESLTRSFRVGNFHGYLTVSNFEDGSPGELFLRTSRNPELFSSGEEGKADVFSMVAGLLDAVAVQTSLLLQYGVPLRVVAAKSIGGKFAPAGRTNDLAQPRATSVLDYVFRFLLREFDPEALIVSAVEEAPAAEDPAEDDVPAPSDPDPPRVPVLATDVIEAASRCFEVSRDQVRGVGRSATLVRARHVAMYVLRADLRKSYPEIGDRMHRHHAAAMHAVKSVAGKIAVGDAQVAEDVRRLRAEARICAEERVAAQAEK